MILRQTTQPKRIGFLGGSDARIIMGNEEAGLLRLWREKRGDIEPQDLSGSLVVQRGLVTDPLNRHWFERKFMLPWSFSEEAAAEKHMPQLQHNMWVSNVKLAVLSIITGGGKWVEITVPADSLYQHLLLTAEKKFWRCVENGEPPRLFGLEPPRQRIEAVRVVDMSASNSWAEFAGIFLRTREPHSEHERARTELKALVPENAKEVMGHGIRAR